MTPKTLETTLDDIRSALAALKPGRADSLEDWWAVGMSIHSWDSGPDGMALWDEWSSQSKEKYDPRAVRNQWNSFKPGGGRTIATLFGMAKEDGWKPAGESRNGAADSPQPSRRRETAPEPSPEPPKEKKPSFWPDLETAKREFEKLPRVIDDPAALEFMAEQYGASEMDLCDGVFADWRVLEWPGKWGIPKGERCIVYPGVTPTGQPGFKMKTVARIEGRPEKQKRASRWLYRPDSPTGPMAFHVKRPSVPLVIVGGEEKAVAAYAAGYSVLAGMDGEGNLIKFKTDNRGNPIVDEDSKAGRRWAQWVAETDPPAVVIAMDADDAGVKATDAVGRAIADAGYPRLQIHRIAWPEGAPEGYDLNDAKKNGQDVRALLSEAEPVQRERLTILSVDEILNMQPQTNDNLLGAYMLMRGGPRYSLVVGAPSIGKSRLVMQMALDVTCGFEFCGLESHGEGTRWLFFQAENRHRRLQGDLMGMLRGSSDIVRRKVGRNISILTPMTEADMFLKFGLPGVADKLKDAVQAFNPDVIVWDPLIEFFGGESENANIEMKECVSEMMRISRCRRSDTAVLILAHASPGKASTAKAYGFDALHFHRGASSLIGAAGASFNIAQADEDDPNKLIMACGKCSDGPKFDPRGLVLDTDRMRYYIDPEFDLEQWKEVTRGTGKVGAGRKKLDETVILSRVNPGETVPFKDVAEAISETHNIDRTTTLRKVRELCQAGILSKEKRSDLPGQPLFITRPE